MSERVCALVRSEPITHTRARPADTHTHGQHAIFRMRLPSPDVRNDALRIAVRDHVNRRVRWWGRRASAVANCCLTAEVGHIEPHSDTAHMAKRTRTVRIGSRRICSLERQS